MKSREVKQPTPGHTASQNWFYIIISATFCEAWRCHGSKVHKRLPCRSRRGLWASAWVLESGQAIWTKTLLPLPSSCGTMGTWLDLPKIHYLIWKRENFTYLMQVLKNYIFLCLPFPLPLSKYVLRFILSHTLKALGYKDGQVAISALDLQVNM